MPSPSSESQTNFWEQKSLEQMNGEEWESLCDGCGKCCLVKLQDEDTDQIAFTNVACKMLDCESCRCTSYHDRLQHVPDCLVLTVDNLPDYATWLPNSCAYKRLYEGKGLPDWHPLLMGAADFMHRKGMSASGKVINETQVADVDLEDHVVAWPGD